MNRSTVRRQPSASLKKRPLDPELVRRVRELIHRFPTFGYRRIWAWLRNREGLLVNKKAVYRVLREKNWMIQQRRLTPRPRVKVKRSQVSQSNQRWAMDLTHIYCGEDGWAHLAAVIDCHDREVIGYEFSMRGRAKEAERALEDACLKRFGTLQRKGARPILRSDNGLIFLSRQFREACRDYGLKQEFITPYTPQQNGLIERFFRSLKEECVWLNNFESFEDGQRAISEWITFYNSVRPHQSLAYQSPTEFRKAKKAAA